MLAQALLRAESVNILKNFNVKCPAIKPHLPPENRRIQELEKQLAQAKSNNELLKKATAFFIRDNPALK